MKIFITGEAGLTAQELEKQFIQSGDDVVWGYKHRSRKYCSFPSIWDDGSELDILGDSFGTILQGSDPDVLIHTAGFVGTDICERFPFKAIETNVLGAMNVAQTVSGMHNTLLVYFSTTAVFDPASYSLDKPITNDTLKKPGTLYGMTKLMGEHIMRSMIPANRLMILRPCFMYGGKLDHHSALIRIIRGCKDSKDVQILMDPENYKDYLHIEDAVAIIRGLVYNKRAGEYNISRGTPKPFKEYVPIISSAMMEKFAVDTLPHIEYFPKEDYLHSHVVDGRAAIQDSGYTPKIEFNTELVRSIYADI